MFGNRIELIAPDKAIYGLLTIVEAAMVKLK